MIRRILVVTAAMALATAALTGCGDQSAPVAAPPSATGVAPVTTSLPEPSVAAPPGTGTPQTQQVTKSESAPVTVVDPAGFAQEGNGIAWVSPSGKIFCRIAEGQYSSGCQSGSAPIPAGADCVTPSFTIDQLSKGFYLNPGLVTPTCFNQGTFGSENSKVLGYNESISSGGFTCTSRMDAMVCDAGGGHGFSLSMQAATWN
ncbi:hypothetical protein QMK17_17005 [Rhodococcus sp. G-MC3]|uniref:DUF6636 domain-containing protein n=1 Tax=Rhodococcus sp. G-MC3 TaxID=3046209 RepID=UPI0024BB0223|nr:DUF6636 domain-containing protein [Rhodococcus sp. G-MC3]MDJ0395025.1 hypothetical protein [Rhodococcus sp. G-MC3]